MANKYKPNANISGSGFSFDNVGNDTVVVGPGVSLVGNGGNSATEQGIQYSIQGYGGSGSTTVTSHDKVYKYYWYDMEYTKTWASTTDRIIVNEYIDIPNWLFNLGECILQDVVTDPDLASFPGITFYFSTKKIVGKQVYVSYTIISTVIHSITFKLRIQLSYLAGYANVFKQEGSDIVVPAACISNTSIDANLKSRYRVSGQEIFAPTRYGTNNTAGSNAWRGSYSYSKYGGTTQTNPSYKNITRKGTFPHFVLRGTRYGPGKELKVEYSSDYLKITYGDGATYYQGKNKFIDGAIPTKVIFLLQAGGGGGGAGCWADDPYLEQAQKYDGGGGGAGGALFCVVNFDLLYSSYRTHSVYVTIGAGGSGGY